MVKLERATLLFSGIQRAESVGDSAEGEKSGVNFLWGKFTFARAFGTAAMQWLSSGEIPERVNSKDKSSKTKSLDLLEWMNYLKTYEFEHDDVQKIVDILVKRKMLVSGIVTSSKESRPVVPYLPEFWNYDVSPYRKERSTLGKELSYTYFETTLGRIKKY